MIDKPLREKFPQFKIGEGTYGGLNVQFWNDGKTQLEIGAYTSIGSDVHVLMGGEHNVEWVSTFPFSAMGIGPPVDGHPATKGNLTIGSDVWIGANAMIMSGVTIGHGAVVGARALVTKDVPAYGVAYGMPARTVKTRFDEPTIKALLAIAWWEWPKERVIAAAPMLQQPDIWAFINAVYEGKI